MEARRVKTLAGLPDERMFKEIAEGLTLIHEHAVQLSESAQLLVREKRFRAARIMQNHAEEESAKYLILLDVVRCPRKGKRLARQLGKFNAHLARCIYAEICLWRPADFKEIRKGIERECEAYYLDGPNEVDWIFRNGILSEREEAMYVDYVESDDGAYWTSPKAREVMESPIFFIDEPAVIGVMRALHTFGIAKPEALALIARMWRRRKFTDETRYSELRTAIHETLNALHETGLADDISGEICGLIMQRWPFPLYEFPMTQTGTHDKPRLREIQERWHPPI